MIKKIFLPLVLIVSMASPAIMHGAQISFYIGKVKLYRNGRAIRPSMGKILKSGDMLITGRRAKVDIRYNDGSRISVKSGSKIQFGSKSIKNSRHIALISGNLEGKFKKLFKGNRAHKIVTPTVVCAVRGTEFKVSVSKSGKSRVDLKTGKLQLDNPAGREYLNRNQQMQADISKPPRIVPNVSKISAWQNKEDKKLKDNPRKIGRDYKKYMQQLSWRSKTQSKEVNNERKVKKAKTVKNLDWIEKKIDESEDKIENDLLLNETTYASIDDILQDYKRRKDRIYKIFYRIKRESNRVRQQQERNYRELQAVKRAYQEAKAKIKNKFEADKKKINSKINLKKYKPSFDFKK